MLSLLDSTLKSIFIGMKVYRVKKKKKTLFFLLPFQSIHGLCADDADAAAARLMNLQCAFAYLPYRSKHLSGASVVYLCQTACIQPLPLSCWTVCIRLLPPTWNIWRVQPPVAIATQCLPSHEKCPLQGRNRHVEMSPNCLFVSLFSVFFPSIHKESAFMR